MSKEIDHGKSESLRSPSVSHSHTKSNLSRTDTQSSHPGLAQSIKSRLRSRSNASASRIDRVYSAGYLDDQAVYHSHDSTDEDGREPALEARDGIVNERDVDLEQGPAAHQELEKSKTARSDRSQRDPYLVRGHCLPTTP